MKLRHNIIIMCGLMILGYNPDMYGSLSALAASLEGGPSVIKSDTDEPKAPEPKAPDDEPKSPEPKVPEPEEPKAPYTEPKAPEPKVPEEPKAPYTEPKAVAPKVTQIPKVGMPKVASIEDSTEQDTQNAIAAKVQPAVGASSLEVVDVHAVTSTGLDTLNVDSAGNWLEKRIWYKKGELLFEAIRSSVQKASDIRMKFVHEVNNAGKKIDEFYETVGLQEGKIEELLKAVLQDLDTAAQYRGGDLSASERALKEKVLSEQKQIEVVGKDVKLIDDLDEQIDKTMMKAFKEIDSCRGLETRAWNNFKDIGNELDDKKARVLYYEMDNFHKNIEQKMNYLQSNLLPYLQSKLVGKVDETITQIKGNVASLHSRGLDLQTLLKKDDQGDLLILKQREGEKEKIAESSWEAQQTKKEKEAQELKAQKEKQRQEAANNVWYRRLTCMVLCGLQAVWIKITDWTTILICCVKCLVCKIQEIICRLIGY